MDKREILKKLLSANEREKREAELLLEYEHKVKGLKDSITELPDGNYQVEINGMFHPSEGTLILTAEQLEERYKGCSLMLWGKGTA